MSQKDVESALLRKVVQGNAVGRHPVDIVDRRPLVRDERDVSWAWACAWVGLIVAGRSVGCAGGLMDPVAGSAAGCAPERPTVGAVGEVSAAFGCAATAAVAPPAAVVATAAGTAWLGATGFATWVFAARRTCADPLLL
jgi:hypothetical protein